MQDLLGTLAALEALREPAALATLVRVKGSSYRQPGARMVFQAGGGQSGVISAGCLETDLKERVASVLATREPQLAAYDMGSDLDLIWGTGMGCQGKAGILLERVEPGTPAPWVALSREMLAARRPGAMATVFAARGAAVGARPGDRFILDPAGPGLPPAPGSGPWELTSPLADALKEALEATLAQGTARTITLSAGPGELDILLEPVLPPYALWIFGAGEHARPLARFAHELGWWVGLLDHRPALATAARFPEAGRIVLGHPPESLMGLPFDGRSAALVVSHVYEQDRQALQALLQQPLGYLGLQGNRTRSARMLRELEESGFILTEAQRRILHIPAGLDLGAEAPELIALSMLAEVQAFLSGHSAGSLRDRQGSIHRP